MQIANDENLEVRTIGGRVREDCIGMRIDRYLAEYFKFFSRASWQKKLSEGFVLVNERPTKANYKLKQGDQIATLHDVSAEPASAGDLKIVWQHGGIMAVEKPPGMPMHENGPYRANTVTRRLVENFGSEWASVHRLDRETSGLVLCANTHELRQYLATGLAQKYVKKKYLALVHGQPSWQHLAVNAPIGDLPESKIRIKKWVQAGGQQALTRFRVIERSKDMSLVEARPFTGRTNQIRIHLAYAGFPLVGDKLFHADEEVFLHYHEKGDDEWVWNQTGHRRCCLHAAGLTFVDPQSNELVNIASPLADDIVSCFEGGV